MDVLFIQSAIDHYSFTSSGQSKAKSAVEAARARHTQLMKEQQMEDEKLMAMHEWSFPDNVSRPQSSNEKALKVITVLGLDA